MTRILFIGDVHIKLGNLTEVDILEQKMVTSSRPKPDLIVVAGDILDTHERVHTQLLNRALKLIKTFRTIAPVFVLVGNHDYINNQQFLSENHWMNAMKEWQNVTIVDTTTTHTVGPNAFVFVPYVPNGRFVEALDMVPDWKDATAIFAHQEIKNCKMGAITSLEGDEWDLGWPMLISGHIHDRQQVQPNMLYPGSVINHSFTNDNQGVSEFTFTPTKKMTEFKIDIGLEKKVIIYHELSRIDELDITSITKNQKLTLDGVLKDIAAFKKSKVYNDLISRKIKVVFRAIESERTNGAPLCGDSQYRPSFATILSHLVDRENDEALIQDYNSIRISDGTQTQTQVKSITKRGRKKQI